MKQNKKNQSLKNLIFILIVVIVSIGVGFLIYQNFILGLAVVLGAFLILMMALSFRLGLILIIVSILGGQLIRVPIPGTEYGAILLSDVLVIVLVVLWLLSHIVDLIQKRKPLPANPINWAIVLFIAVAIISLINGSRHLSSNEILSSSFYLVRLAGYMKIGRASCRERV
jgi:hypothetical protein